MLVDLILAILGVVLIIVGVFWLIGGALLGGVVLVVVGLLLLGWRGYGFYGPRRGPPL